MNKKTIKNTLCNLNKNIRIKELSLDGEYKEKNLKFFKKFIKRNFDKVIYREYDDHWYDQIELIEDNYKNSIPLPVLLRALNINNDIQWAYCTSEIEEYISFIYYSLVKLGRPVINIYYNDFADETYTHNVVIKGNKKSN